MTSRTQSPARPPGATGAAGATTGRTGGVALMVAVAAAVALWAGAAPAGAQVTGPVFVDGQAQIVFSTSSATWIRQEGWAESTIDSDFDGKLDRIHFDITRPMETSTIGLKVPVVMEVSPYYAGGANVPNWGVDHEIGFPPTTKPGFTRTIGNTSPIISNSLNATWVPRGFAVMHVEGTGTGHSEGCPTSGDRNETLGPKAVVDWLNGNARAYTSVNGDEQMFPTWTTGKVGMVGTSYNGTLPIGIATTGVQGLEAIVPVAAISSWYDYYRANGAVRAPGGFQGEDLDVLADYTYSRQNQSICQAVIDNIRAVQDRVTGDYSTIWHQRNYMKDIDGLEAATLVVHGNTDWNVMTKHAGELYNALRDRGIDRQFYFHQGGHANPLPLFLLNRWFSRYLWDHDNGVENDPKSMVVREANACPPRTATVAGDQSNTAVLTVADSSGLAKRLTLTIPQTNANGTITNTTRVINEIPDATTVVLASAVATAAGQRVADGAILSIVCGNANPTFYEEWPDPAAGPARLSFRGNAPGVGDLTTQKVPVADELFTDNAGPGFTPTALFNATTSPHRLVFKTPVLQKDIRLSGTPTISLKVSFSKPKANLTAYLVHYPAGAGNGTLLTRGWIDPENPHSPSKTEPITPGEPIRLRFDMQPKDMVVVAGRRLGIMIISSDRDFTVRPAPGTQVTVDLDESFVTLPVVGGQEHLNTSMYDWAGFLATVENPPVLNQAHSNNVERMQFSLGGDLGLGILAAGAPASRQIDCDSQAPLGALEPTQTPNWDSLSYSAYNDRYSYPWKTVKAWKGTCREFVLTLADGSTHNAWFRFVK